MADGNPFGPPPGAPAYPTGGGGYPFDVASSQGSVGSGGFPPPPSYGGAPPAPPQGGAPLSYPAMTADPSSSQYQPPPSDNPFGSPPFSPPAASASSYGQQQQQQQQQPFLSSPYGQPQPPTPTSSTFSPSGYSMAPAPATSNPAAMGNPFQAQSDSIVVSQFPSNPYSGMTMMTSPNQPQLQHQQQGHHHGGGATGTFDPFAAPPAAPAPSTDLVPAPASSNPYGQMVSYGGQPPPSHDPFGSSSATSAPAPLAPPSSSYPEDDDPLAAFGGTPKNVDKANDAKKDASSVAAKEDASLPRDREGTHYDSSSSSPDRRPPNDGSAYLGPTQYDYGQRSPDSSAPAPNEATISPHVRNPYREELARRAPPGSSPLPKADLVRKRGYVLSRISFRTIVMKKWKQSYWVQYGPHTMLWFRSEADFTDWLNNPYHDQSQRNFLIKLAVNFVHDLYKPNVRGYQVTQCRTKAYGNKMVRQFKLERWMDYGPTIAAAFGSYNPREVDELREAIVECMRNTPLNSGIRATGAVRQRPSQSQDSEDTYNQRDDRSDDSEGTPDDRNGRRHNERPSEEQNGKAGADSVAEESDLLDVDNWDDVPGQGQQHPPNGMMVPYQQQQQQQQQSPYPPPQQQYPPQYPAGYAQASYGAQPVPQQQQQLQQPPPQSYPPPQQAIVPVTGAPPSYPGAPPPQAYGMPPSQPQVPPPQAQAYPAAVQDPWGPPAQQPPQYVPHPSQQPPPQPYGQPPQYPQPSAFPYQ